jgi:GDPmannose 4,6-dehydratase
VSAGVSSAALVTGVAGQDGTYLARALRRRGYRVVGTVAPGSAGRAVAAGYLSDVDVIEVDVRDSSTMRELIERVGPDEVYNLASLSSVGSSWSEAEEVAEVNGAAVRGLLDSILRYRDESGRAPRFFQASSAEVLGGARMPIDEAAPIDPVSPYGTAKSVAHRATIDVRGSDGLFAVNGILFNHESPLRPPTFVTRRITLAAARLAEGDDSILTLGNLDARRDWGAAVDYVEAMWLMLQAPAPEDYVIASGTPSSVRDLVDLAFAAAGLTDPWERVRVEPAAARPSDRPEMWGDPGRARRNLGWTASTPLSELIAQMVEVDRARARTGTEDRPDLVFPAHLGRSSA